MFNFTINLNNDKPIYLQIYQQIAENINSGILKSNEKLPSKRVLAQHLNVSINTIINAYNILLDEGYIISIEKKGYYVASQEFITINKSIYESPKIKALEYQYDLTTQITTSMYFSETSLKKAIKNAFTKDYMNKSPFEGLQCLRQAISRHLLENRGIEADYNQIIIGSGIEMLASLFPILKSNSYAIENPGYHKLAAILKNNDIDVEYVPLDQNGASIPKKSNVLYTTSFNQFPTGIKMSIARKKELVQWAINNNSFIIEDDFDAEFRILSAPTTSLYSLACNNVIFFSTFSATIFSGLRIAYMIIPKSILNKYNELYCYYSNTVPTLNQYILYEYLSSGDYARHINRLKKQYLNKRKIIIEFFKNIPAVKIDEKKNFLSVILKTDKDSKILVKQLSKLGIKIKSISDYDVYDSNYNSLLIGYTNIQDNKLLEALEIIKQNI